MINKVFPFSEMLDWVFGIILLGLVLFNAPAINSLVGGFSKALSSGLTAVKP